MSKQRTILNKNIVIWRKWIDFYLAKDEMNKIKFGNCLDKFFHCRIIRNYSEIPNGTTSIFWIARITVEKSVIKKIYVQRESHFENEAYGDNDLQFLFAITAFKNKTTLAHIKLQFHMLRKSVHKHSALTKWYYNSTNGSF